jgi:hypothetical protein
MEFTKGDLKDLIDEVIEESNVVEESDDDGEFISYNTTIKKDGKNYVLTQGKGEDADDVVLSEGMAKALLKFMKSE